MKTPAFPAWRGIVQLGLLFAALTAPFLTARASLDMFLTFAPSVPGESKDSEFKDKIDVLAWSWGAANPATVSAGAGTSAGKASLQDLSLTKYLDKSSPPLLLALLAGTHYDTVTLTVRLPGDNARKVLTITLKNVLVTSLSTGGSGGEDRLTENISLNFAEIKVEYVAPGATAATAETTASWNVAENKPVP